MCSDLSAFECFPCVRWDLVGGAMPILFKFYKTYLSSQVSKEKKYDGLSNDLTRSVNLFVDGRGDDGNEADTSTSSNFSFTVHKKIENNFKFLHGKCFSRGR